MRLVRKLITGSRVIWAFAYSLTVLVIERPQSRRARAEWLTRFCRRVLRVAEISCEASGPVPQSGAVISNHLSYLDILLHAALRPCVFVAAIEIRRMPLIGWISMMAGTVYVVRGGGGSAAQAADGMAAGFRDGLPVVFFPEGGTGVGDVPLLPLHSGLLANALEAEVPVTPGFIQYSISPEDAADNLTVRDDVAWGEQALPAHLWNLLGLGPLHGKILFGATPIVFSADALADRKIATDQARDAILVLTGPGNNDPISLLK